MPRQRPIGIDLGTSFSAAAWVDESGKTAMIRNAEGELLTPSVVLFGDKEVVVGKEAQAATTANPEFIAQWVKRELGLPHCSRPIHGRWLPPEVIQACILRKLKADIVRSIDEPGRAVITVPACFDEAQRKGTADAAGMAGLKVLDIVNEPTAAALAFAETLGYLVGQVGNLPADGSPSPDAGRLTAYPATAGESQTATAMTILVYRLGGGTFDATLLRLSPGKIETIATDGDVHLGGHDWHMRLADYLADSFRRAHRSEPREDPAAMNRILAAAIDAKHALSARDRTTVRIEAGGQTMETLLTRERFEKLTADLLERTACAVRQLLAAGGTEWKNVDRLLLVGGSTRMPMIVDLLRKLSGLEPDLTVQSDEAVARGAALYAACLMDRESGNSGGASLTITNVNSHSLGVEAIDPETMQERHAVLIPHNPPLPATFTERFVTRRADQRSMVLSVAEGENGRAAGGAPIGRMAIRDLPEGLPANWPIDVTFEYDASGRLSFSAMVSGTERAATLELERRVGLTPAGIARWKQPVRTAAGFAGFAGIEEESQDKVEADAVAELDEAVFAFAAGNRPVAAEPDAIPIPRWLFSAIGYVVFSSLGLGLGYLIMHWLMPDAYPLHW
ncbi:MAG: Hsp70 family protein [Thermoguttaceae bacterium]